MSQQDKKQLKALLDADPALRAAWDGFRGILARVSGQIAQHHEPAPSDMDKLREAALRVRAEAGEDQARH